jgi:hypothetical protein
VNDGVSDNAKMSMYKEGTNDYVRLDFLVSQVRHPIHLGQRLDIDCPKSEQAKDVHD